MIREHFGSPKGSAGPGRFRRPVIARNGRLPAGPGARREAPGAALPGCLRPSLTLWFSPRIVPPRTALSLQLFWQFLLLSEGVSS
jgi:hypothetical protein